MSGISIVSHTKQFVESRQAMVAIVSAKPKKVFRSQEIAGRALWIANLVGKLDDEHKTHVLSDGITVSAIPERLADMCVSTTKTPTTTEAYALHRHLTLCIPKLFDYQGCECCGNMHGIFSDRHIFPWHEAWSYLTSDIPDFQRVTYDAIGYFKLDWREREELRSFGVYNPLPWVGEISPIDAHFAHIAMDDPSLVAFTQNAAKGARDIQTKMKPGRYLTQFYPSMDPDIIRTLSAKVGTPSVKFAITADEIEKVYTQGPSSCMHPSSKDYRQVDQNPVRAYGDSDLQVAYLTDASGTVCARAVVWPEKKVYFRAYGDIPRLQAQLEELKYTKRGEWCFEGAKIRRVNNPDGSYSVLMPHIDGHGKFDVTDDNYLMIKRNGPQIQSRGYTALQKPEPCGCGCGQMHIRAAGRVVHSATDRQVWSPSCFDEGVMNYRIYRCASDAEYYTKDAIVIGMRFGREGHNVSAKYAQKNGFKCSGSGVWFTSRHHASIVMADGTVWESAYFQNNGRTVNGKNYPLQLALELEALHAAKSG